MPRPPVGASLLANAPQARPTPGAIRHPFACRHAPAGVVVGAASSRDAASCCEMPRAIAARGRSHRRPPGVRGSGFQPRCGVVSNAQGHRGQRPLPQEAAPTGGRSGFVGAASSRDAALCRMPRAIAARGRSHRRPLGVRGSGFQPRCGVVSNAQGRRGQRPLPQEVARGSWERLPAAMRRCVECPGPSRPEAAPTGGRSGFVGAASSRDAALCRMPRAIAARGRSHRRPLLQAHPAPGGGP